MRLASYVPGELIPCAFVWLGPEYPMLKNSGSKSKSIEGLN